MINTNLLLIVGYLSSRLQNLATLPIFGDEAIYVRWAQLIKNVPSLFFVPLSDGKQPLFMWLNALTLRLFSDPLFSGRLISVISGLAILLLLHHFLTLYFSRSVANIASLIYLTLPFSFFFDRMALADNLLSFFGLLSLYFSLNLAKKPQFKTAVYLGLVLGLSWLTKSPAVYFISLSVITFLGFNFANLKKIYLVLFSGLIAFFLYNLLRLSPEFHLLASRNRDYILSLSEFLSHPLYPFLPHLRDLIDIYHHYISLPLILLASAGLFISLAKKSSFPRHLLIVFFWWLAPTLVNCALGKTFTSRYLLYTLPPLIIIVSFTTDKLLLLNSRLKLLFVLSLIPNILWLRQISTSPFTTFIPKTESGYLHHWTSGWGIKEASVYLKSRAKEVNVIVGTEGFFGTLPNGLQIYTDGVKQLTVIGTGIDIHQIPEQLVDAKNYGDEVYLLFNRSRLKLIPDDLASLKLVTSYPKPYGDQLLFYQL